MADGNTKHVDERTRLIERSNHGSGTNGKLYLCTSVSLVAALSIGYSLGYSAPAIPSMKGTGIITTDDEASWFGSLVALGAVVGGPVAMLFIDRGRKFTIMLCAVPYVAGWVAIATAKDIPGLYIGRIVTGLGVGMSSSATPVYITEMARPNLRGLLGGGFQLLINVGILITYALGIPLNYKYLALIGAAFAVILIIFMSLMPDTPRYLLINHQRGKALRVLEWMRGSQIQADIECREIEDGLKEQEPLSIRDFLTPAIYKPLLIGIGLMFFQQWSGINAVTFNAVEIFQTAAPSIDPNVASVIMGVSQVLGTFFAVMVVDKVGRRVLLIVAGGGMAISSATFGLYYVLTDKNSTHHNSSMVLEFDNVATTASASSDDLSWLSLTSMLVYFVAFSIGQGPIPWLIIPEMLPFKARGAANAIASSFNWAFAFSVTQSFSTLKKETVLGEDGVFWLFAAVNALGVVFTILLVPETKGLSLEKIEARHGSHSNRDDQKC